MYFTTRYFHFSQKKGAFTEKRGKMGPMPHIWGASLKKGHSGNPATRMTTRKAIRRRTRTITKLSSVLPFSESQAQAKLNDDDDKDENEDVRSRRTMKLTQFNQKKS